MLGLHPETPPSSGTSVTLVQDKPRVPVKSLIRHLQHGTLQTLTPLPSGTPQDPPEGSQRLLFRIPQNCPHSRAPRAPPDPSCRAPQGPSGHPRAQPPSPQDRDSSTNAKQLPLHWCCSNTLGVPTSATVWALPRGATVCRWLFAMAPAACVSPQPWVLLSAHPCCPHTHSGQVSRTGPE